MSESAWIDACAAGAIAPELVQRALTQLAARWPAELPPIRDLVAGDFGGALAHLLSVSPVSAQKLLDDPASLLWLARPEISRSERGPLRMLTDYKALCGGAPESARDFENNFRALRRCKARELLRIALREVAGWSSVEQSTLEITCVAELCLRVVTDAWLAELTRKWGQPATSVAVLGMGKLGGQDLNFSSDIDVFFIYGEDGNLNPRFTYREFFTRLAEKIVATFSSNAGGPLFRIDLRLRPEGDTGPLVRSLDSLEDYYAAFGETWERMALSKARVVAGSAGADELGYDFAQRLQAFIYPRALSLEVVEEIRALKSRIEREIVGLDDLRRNVKLGYGGIREIEFVTQALQLVHGAKHAFLQERSTLKALRNLRELDLLPAEDVEALIAAYRFLRLVEHRLQIEHEAQTHTLPESSDALARLAASLGFSETHAFQAELARHTEKVRANFDAVLGAPTEEAAPPAVDLSFFRDSHHAQRALDDLGGAGTTARFAPRTKKLFTRLEPQLLAWLRRVAEPDAALTGFVRFVERYGSRGLLYETLLASPRVLETLVRLFDASRFMTEVVVRRPQLIEEIARTGSLSGGRTIADHLAGLSCNEEGLPWQEWVRAYRCAQILRIGLRDILAFATLRDLQAEYSALAEACLLFAQEQLGFADTLTVVALGKFGGRELGYGADLDVVFIGDDAKAAAALVQAMSSITAEGRVFPVDARLRPEGDAGPLICTLSSYEAYSAKRAQFWEAQALTKARAISGPQRAEFDSLARAIWRRSAAEQDVRREIAAMHARVVRERAVGGDELEFKTGTGGLMQAEFFVQAQQMRTGLWEPNTFAALTALPARGALSEPDATRLSDRYIFLRRVESVLRRMDDKSVSRLPDGDEEQRALAVRCGFATRDEFLAEYRAAREDIRKLAPL